MAKEGRPTKYRKEYCQEILEFFDIEPTIEREVTIITKKGDVITKNEIVANRLPTFERFAVKINVDTDTLVEWGKVHPQFSVTVKKCKNLQKNFLIENGTTGLFNPAFTIFVAKNITDMRDKVQNEYDVSEKMQEAIDRFSDLFPK